MQIVLPNVKFTTATKPGRAGGVITQNISFQAHQSAPNANDDAKLIITNASALAA